MSKQLLRIYNGSVLIDTLHAPEGGKLEPHTEASGALKVSKWFFGDPLEIRQPFCMFSPGSWTKVEEGWE